MTKDEFRKQVIDEIIKMSKKSISWSDVTAFQHKIYPNAKRFGLIKEFRENGIL